MMSCRQRIEAAVSQQPHDRIPIDLGGTFATGVTAQARVALSRELGITLSAGRIVVPELMIAEIEAPLRKALGCDTIGLYLGDGYVHGWIPWQMPGGLAIEMPGNVQLVPRQDGRCDLLRQGKLVATMAAGSCYFDAIEYPKWRDYPPADLTDALLENIARRVEFCHNETDLAVILNVPYTIFNGTNPDFLCALLVEPDEVHEQVEKWTQHIILCLDRLLDAVRDHVSVMAFSGDAGSQKAPLVGPQVYREMLLPHFRKIPEYLHRKSRIKFFYHTCGSVYKLIPSFIDLGVDILNPLQVTAADMEAERLVAEFGGRLVFWGGGIDTQHTLVHGSEADVRARVRRQLRTYASVPGYVFAFDHNLQADVPPRNVLAALEEVRNYRGQELL
jgi:uroporphyrinogen decarboxylase